MIAEGSDNRLTGGQSKYDDAPDVVAAHIEWSIDDVLQKLRQNRGSPLTSHIFEIGGMPDLRLMLVPGEPWLAKGGPSSKRARQPRLLETVPAHGALRVKSMTSEFSGSLKFVLSVGSCRQGRFERSFADKPVHECLFTSDWTELMDKKTDSLTLRLDFC